MGGNGGSTGNADTSKATTGGGGNPGNRLNLKAITEYCLRAKYHDDVYPIYVMLLQLLFNVNDQEWIQAKETIQAHLEKLAPRGSNNTTIHGDVVGEKNVRNVETVEANGVGFVEKAGAPSPKRDGRKKTEQAGKVVKDVYKYIYYDSEGGAGRIAKLYQTLLKYKWIDQDTNPDIFLQLFSGEPLDFHIKWTGAQSDLYALIKKLCDEKLITCPHGVGRWEIAKNHFLNKQSKTFRDWHKQKEKKGTQTSIEILVNLLVPKA